MNSLIKKEIEDSLKKLRQGKNETNNYLIITPRMAMCYSPIFKEYEVSYYSGKHICNNCKKEFGVDLKERIAACREDTYNQYLLSDDNTVLIPQKACFRSFLDSYNKNNPVLLDYLKQHHLKVALSKPQKEVFLKKRFEVECSFNRKLSFEEWTSLNTDCYLECNSYGMETKGVCSQCFEYDKSYKAYEEIVEEYNRAGFNVQLKYNCEDCCNNGKNELEFWLKIKGQDEYLISYPKMGNTREMRESAGYNDYTIVLEFLKGKTDYLDLIGEYHRSIIEKCDIDRALNAILKANILYDKSEIIKHFEAVYSNCRGFKRDGEDQKKSLFEEYSNEILSKYPDDYRFSPDECSDLMSEYRSFLHKY